MAAVTMLLMQASPAVRDFETKEEVRVFLLPHKVGASGLTLNRGQSILFCWSFFKHLLALSCSVLQLARIAACWIDEPLLHTAHA